MIFEGRIVWLFREPRSGGTCLSNHLAAKLNRVYGWVDPRQVVELFQQPMDEHKLLNTHRFGILQSMKNYDNPILMRCYRKNIAEQFLSMVFIGGHQDPVYNITNDQERNQFDANLQRSMNSKRMIKKEHLDSFVVMKTKFNKLWNDISVDYESYDVCYEDLVTGIDLFGLGQIDMQDYTQKLPEDYKSKAFLNYNEIKQWASMHNNDTGLI